MTSTSFHSFSSWAATVTTQAILTTNKEISLSSYRLALFFFGLSFHFVLGTSSYIRNQRITPDIPYSFSPKNTEPFHLIEAMRFRPSSNIPTCCYTAPKTKTFVFFVCFFFFSMVEINRNSQRSFIITKSSSMSSWSETSVYYITTPGRDIIYYKSLFGACCWSQYVFPPNKKKLTTMASLCMCPPCPPFLRRSIDLYI